MRLQIQKESATLSGQGLSPSINAKSGSNCMVEFAAVEVEALTQEFVALNKTEQTFDLYALRIRTFDTEPEHWGAMKPPEDWPAPEYLNLINVVNDWYQTTLIGAANLADCDIDSDDTTVKVYDSDSGPPPGNVAPKSGIIAMESEQARYASRGSTSFNGLTRGIYDVHAHSQTFAVAHHGHDMGAQNPGPPPVPPDTAHDPVFIKAFSTSLIHFVAQASEQTAMLMRPMNYVPPGSKNGIFMPIIMRYLADRWVRKAGTVIDSVMKKIPPAQPDPTVTPKAPEPVPTSPQPGGGSGLGTPIDSGQPNDGGLDPGDFGKGGPGGYLML